MLEPATSLTGRPQQDIKAIPRRKSLAWRLLTIAAGFVVLTEAVVFLPTLGTIRREWLTERFDTGELAVLAQNATDQSNFPQSAAPELLQSASIESVTLIQQTQRTLLVGQASSKPALAVDLENQLFGEGIAQSLGLLFAPGDRVLAITARPRSNAAVKLEVRVNEAPLRERLLRQAGEVVLGSLALAILIGALLYSALADGFVRPMRRLTGAIARFRAAPEDASRALRPSGRDDEIGQAEEAFADMQDALRQALLQRERLAQLGGAVSRISHDLRHSLGAAQLVSERLAMVDDPVVAATAPRLERALERAIGLAESTLRFGKAEERPPMAQAFHLARALDEAAEEALAGLNDVAWSSEVTGNMLVLADSDHAHRIFTNLIRNAGQAIVRTGQPGAIAARCSQTDTLLSILLTDTGPGLPTKAKENLFAPFSGAGVSGGTGLGLAIARDLARMNGGDVTLVSTGPKGTVFNVTLPYPEREGGHA